MRTLDSLYPNARERFLKRMKDQSDYWLIQDSKKESERDRDDTPKPSRASKVSQIPVKNFKTYAPR
jgi:hypothetical protein